MSRYHHKDESVWASIIVILAMLVMLFLPTIARGEEEPKGSGKNVNLVVESDGLGTVFGERNALHRAPDVKPDFAYYAESMPDQKPYWHARYTFNQSAAGRDAVDWYQYGTCNTMVTYTHTLSLEDPRVLVESARIYESTIKDPGVRPGVYVDPRTARDGFTPKDEPNALFVKDCPRCHKKAEQKPVQPAAPKKTDNGGGGDHTNHSGGGDGTNPGGHGNDNGFDNPGNGGGSNSGGGQGNGGGDCGCTEGGNNGNGQGNGGGNGTGNEGNGNGPGGGNSGDHGNNGVGNGVDPAPPGNPSVNDGAGTGPGNPGNQGGSDNSNAGGNGNGKGKDK